MHKYKRWFKQIYQFPKKKKNLKFNSGLFGPPYKPLKSTYTNEMCVLCLTYHWSILCIICGSLPEHTVQSVPCFKPLITYDAHNDTKGKAESDRRSCPWEAAVEGKSLWPLLTSSFILSPSQSSVINADHGNWAPEPQPCNCYLSCLHGTLYPRVK